LTPLISRAKIVFHQIGKAAKKSRGCCQATLENDLINSSVEDWFDEQPLNS
jgi:hypothetical protein